MGRYSGKAVTVTNDFVSQESNTIDPNSDKNPLLDNSDPSKGSEADREHGDDFQVVGEDLVEVKKVTENEVYEEGEVLNKITSIDNIVKEGQTNSSVIEALAAVSIEMYGILGAQGKLSPGEYMAVSGIVASCEAAMPSLRETETVMPSMEDFKIPGLGYSNTNVSMEGILEKLETATNNLNLNLDRLFKNGIGLATSITPLINNQLKRAKELQGTLNGARRDAGQKEVKGGFINALMIDNAAPDAATTIKTAKYLNQCINEVTSSTASDEAKKLITQLQQTVRNGVDGETIKSPSIILHSILAGFAVRLVFGAAGVAGSLANKAANAITKKVTAKWLDYKVNKQIKLDGSVAPELFKLYPTVAKVQTSSPAGLDGRHSLPLFGNRVITVTQYSREVDSNAFDRIVPSIRLEKAGKAKAGASMEALDPSQQKEVLDSAIAMLTAAGDYYRDYAKRNRNAMDVSKTTLTLIQEVRADTSPFTQRAVRNAFTRTMAWYTNMFWRGIFADQSKIANYARSTSKALIDLVEASSAGSQGGSVSTEAFSDFL